ncbi:hypothetical protein DICVIV_02469 [Dictyocaulus viviparus]|uniref:Acid ceramidase N-terminal domain-containing protein n=1 Tax=Dictyocaulus viviparus TaxID=29172 RepID=A0A0D8Y3R4_DICVI|nr:hypothetical protein DICVIV_02469 [Dictyocaulus viviparus]
MFSMDSFSVMRFIVPLFITFFVCCCYARYPKRYVVDLDRAPADRWNEVVHDHLDLISSFMRTAESYVPKHILPVAFFIAKQLNRFFPHEYAEEIRGIARESGLPMGYIVSMNILYDILAFDRKHILRIGCTSIVAQNGDGIILHGRNLDYGVENLLKNITILVDFVRLQGQTKVIAYSGITFAMSTTLLTGQNDAFSVSLNARCKLHLPKLIHLVINTVAQCVSTNYHTSLLSADFEDDTDILRIGCTSIVAQNGDGIILHGRNLDYGVENLLKNITILVDFVRLRGQTKVS